ncbi:hypothetical protein DPMN_085829 [Dreissena polymorpha]|uniref:Uncharacterized protein n=1 Tax=Dreissena polymorpha TaxID=45954 RepID=A0A9D3YGU1_DREPO|nr:hypothetical protein DPMN_085829 [Dreissena polymorpha]
MGNCLCKCKRNEDEVEESAEERESNERRRKVIADLVKLAMNDYGHPQCFALTVPRR